VNTMESMFMDCRLFNQDLSNFNTALVQTMAYMFYNCYVFNESVANFNTANVINMTSMFHNCYAFNQSVSSFSTPKVTTFGNMFYNARVFNQSVVGFDTSKAHTISNMFSNFYGDYETFKQSLSTWNIGLVTNIEGIFTNNRNINDTGTTTNYDNTLIAWAAQSVKPNLNLDFGASKYSSAALAARNTLTSAPNNWTITDGGQEIIPFTITVDTTKAGSVNNTFVLPTAGSGTYNYDIEWGDNTGVQHVNSNTNETHVYAAPGIYDIKIKGTFPRIYFNNTGDRLKITDIKKWGDVSFLNMTYAFFGCSNLTCSATDSPVLTYCSSLGQMFRACNSFNSSIDFNAPIATDSAFMFYGCGSLTNKTIKINAPNMTSMTYMFGNCANFTGVIDFSDTSKVTNMSSMFASCLNFNSSVACLNTSMATNMYQMFYDCANFNQSVSHFDTSKVTNMSQMFYYTSYFNQSLANFNTDLVNNMNYMFGYNGRFNQSVSSFNTSNVTNMSGMFESCVQFNQSLSNFNTALVTNFSAMLENCPEFHQPLDNFSFASAATTTYFCNGTNLNTVGTTTNYDNTLVALAAQDLPNSLSISFGSSKYSAGVGAPARAAIIADDLWTITDGGQL